mgnify:CR=1 FL=1
MNKQPIAKTYHANISPGSGDGPVLTLDRAICQGRENTPITGAGELKALIVAKGVTRVMIADTRFLQRGYSTAAFRAQPGRKGFVLLSDRTIAKLWQ